MEAAEEVTRAAIDPTIPDSQQATTGDISPATDPTQPADNARGVGPNNIQQEDEDLQLISPNGIPGSVALGINFNCDVFKHNFLMRDATWRSERPRKIVRSNPSKKSDVLLLPNAGAEAPTSRKEKRRWRCSPKMHSKMKNTVARMLEECERAVERNTSLEEELVIAQRKIDELEQRVKESEVQKPKMLTRVTTMGRRGLHDVLQGYHIKNHQLP
ncbi:hypothetical protein R1flu_017373 [Riccia fluitans]|uniref:Uncharacterized protein n=1 Tax=Riccia fluitans TaxID=41844 RepID=A0ABD1ZCS3_9MARC